MHNQSIPYLPPVNTEELLKHLPAGDTPPVGYRRVNMSYRAAVSEDMKDVLIQFNVPVSRLVLTQKDARALATVLKKLAAKCIHTREDAPPPIRDRRYMEKENDDANG